LNKEETRRDSSLMSMISNYTVIKTCVFIFMYVSFGREDGCRCDWNT